MVLNVLLAVFNMVPVPPLGGGNVLMGVLPVAGARVMDRLRPWGFLILYALMLSGALMASCGPCRSSCWVTCCDESATRGLGHAPDRKASPRPPGRRPPELGAAAGDVDCFYFVADWHALTSHYADTGDIVENALDNVADWIGAGLDPERSVFFVQSLVPEHAELYLLLQMVTPIPWLERVPTYKEQMEQLAERDLSSIGFLGYPCSRPPTSSSTAPMSCPSARIRCRTSS